MPLQLWQTTGDKAPATLRQKTHTRRLRTLTERRTYRTGDDLPPSAFGRVVAGVAVKEDVPLAWNKLPFFGFPASVEQGRPY